MKISIIIPTFNEACCLSGTISAAKALEGDFEILIVDGESSDETIEIAKQHGITPIPAPRGRASQMNCGSSAAHGQVLLFLHADTLLPKNAYSLIEAALGNPDVVGGCFRLRFDSDRPALRFYGFCTRFSFPLFHYGDSSYFIKTEGFRKLQGYRPYPIMEDLDLWLRMRKCGRVLVLNEPVVTSSRRFLRSGILKQQSLAAALVILFLLGVSPHRLKRFYGDAR